jgi:hypothetical protein
MLRPSPGTLENNPTKGAQEKDVGEDAKKKKIE